jgi:hypothetical protein
LIFCKFTSNSPPIYTSLKKLAPPSTVNDPPLPKPIAFVEFNKLKIPFSNLPLVHDDLLEALKNAIYNNHLEIEKVLEKYYFRSFAIKEIYIKKPPVPLYYD